MDDKERRQIKILNAVRQEPRSWSYLNEMLDVSEPTLSRYIDEMKEEGVIKKVIWEDSVKYSFAVPDIDEDLPDEELERWVSFLKSYNLELEEQLTQTEILEEAGFYDEGISVNQLTEILKEHEELHPNLAKEKEMFTEDGELTIYGLASFLFRIPANRLEDDTPIYADSIRTSADPADDIDEIKEGLRNNKEAIEAIQEHLMDSS